MLWLGDNLVFNVVDIALDSDVLRLACDFYSCTLGLGLGACRRVGDGKCRLKCDHGSNRGVVAEPGMLANIVKLHSLLRIWLQKLGYEVLSDATEPPRPLYPLIQNVVE